MSVIEAHGVSKQFFLRHNASVELKSRFLGMLHPGHRESIEEFWALKDVTLRINPGEAIGLVGRNGSGKSTLLKLIAAVYRPTTGRLLVSRNARISSMIELGVGFHHELTGRENIFLNAAIHGLTKEQIQQVYDAIVSYSGLEHFIDVPIKNYSSGMYMRLGFAIAANLDPDILLLDEIFAVGDADFQHRCTATLHRFLEEGKTLIFVSHSAAAIRSICRRVCILEHGQLVFDGDLERGLAFYDRLLDTNATDASCAMQAESLRLIGNATLNEIGEWQFALLRDRGLQPHHHVLEMGYGALPTSRHLLRFLESGRYLGLERNPSSLEGATLAMLRRAGVAVEPGQFVVNESLDLNTSAGRFDFVVAESVFCRLPFNSVARCLAGSIRALKPLGRLYATWFENPEPASFAEILRPNGVTTFPDREPFHYPFDLIETVCHALGASADRLPSQKSPTGETVLVITRNRST